MAATMVCIKLDAVSAAPSLIARFRVAVSFFAVSGKFCCTRFHTLLKPF